MKFKMRSLKPTAEDKKEAKPSAEAKFDYMLPNIILDADKVPEIATLKKGDKCVLIFNAEVAGAQTGTLYGSGDKEETRVNFKLTHAAVKDTAGKVYKNLDAAYAGAVEASK